MSEEIVIKTVLDLSGSEQKLKQQIEKALGVRADAETKHVRRIETITTQSNARLVEIEKRKQSQFDLIRERAAQKEIEHSRKIEREAQRAANSLTSVRTAVTAIQGAFVALGAAGALSFFENLAKRAIDAAIAIDRQVNTLKALTGSAEAATRRFGELFALAQKTPGLTTNLALTLDTQLRVLNVAEQTINRLLPAVGRLNAIAPLGDPARFAGNLTQLITQGFEKQDLKELVGNSPFAGQLIKEIFNVDSPTNAAAIRESARKLGINTVDEFFLAFAKAAENNPRLQAVQESLGTQFEKLQDRITVALAPIGDELLKTIIPAFREFVELLERDLPKITAFLRDNRDEFLAVAGAIAFMTDKVSQLVGVLGRLEVSPGLSVIRLLSVLGATVVGGPGAGITLGRSLAGADRRRASLQSRLPFGVSIEDTLGAIRNPVTGSVGGGATFGGGGGDDEASRAAKKLAQERARQLAEAKKNSAEALDVFMKGNIEDLEAISKIINDANALAKKERDARARRLIEGRETRQRLTAEFEAAEVAELERTSRRGLTRSGRSIGESFNRGALTPGEAEALSQAANREFADNLRKILALEQERGKLSAARKEDLEDEIALYDRLGSAISDSDRFMRGFNSAIQTSGDAFERFGQNVSNAFRNVRDLFNGLKSAVLGFFNDLLGNSIQNLVRGVLGPLFGGGGGGGTTGGVGGLLGNLFRTPSFAGGGGISAPASISAQSATGIFANGAFGAGLSGGGGGLGGLLGGIFGGGGSAGGSGFSLGGLLGGLAGAAPLLGLGLGAGLGGQSTLGNIFGAIGGGAVGLGASFGASVFSAGGGLAQAGLAALGPIALIGAPLLVGAILLGKAAQRRKDEEASGQMLTKALQGIEQLAAGISSGQIPGSQARSIFDTNILGVFKQEIGTLKTKSVRDSRLTNQVADLEKVYQARIPPLIAEANAQQLRLSENADRFSRQVPQFATGGTTSGGLAFLHPGEKILNRQQQAAVINQSNPSVFERAGVPGASQNRNFDIGGTMGSGGVNQPIQITLEARVMIGRDDATRIVVVGASTPQGRQVTVKNVQQARTDGDL